MTRCVAMAVFLSWVHAGRASDPLDNWHWRAPLPQGYTLNGAAGTTNLYVVVGELGTVLVSTNGIDWAPTTAPVLTNLNAVCFASDRFVAVGDGGTILTSTTGTIWTRRTSPTTNDLHSLTYGHGLFVAVGNYGTVLTSSTGAAWTSRSAQLGTNVIWTDVTFGNDGFVTVGYAVVSDYTVGTSAASPDAINWQQASGPTLPTMGSVTFGNGVFLAAANSQFLTSLDGLQWNSYYLGLGINATDLTFANNHFIASSAFGILRSPDGTNWTAAAGASSRFESIAVAAGHGIAVGRIGQLATSTNLIDWAMISSGPSTWFKDVTFANGLFVGVNGINILTSGDGHAWTRLIAASHASLDGVAYGAGVFVAVGHPYFPVTNLISSDAVSWTPLHIPTPNGLYGITFADGRFVAVGAGGTVCESIDATNWTTHTVTNAGDLQAICHDHGRFVVGGPGAIHVSDDLENWTMAGGSNVNWFAVAHGNGMFVAGGVTQYGKTALSVMRSFDGLTWEAGTQGPSLNGLAFGRGTFVGAGQAGIFTSTNGLNWTLRQNPLFPFAQAVGFGRETFVVSRFEGGIMQSDEVLSLPRLAMPAYLQGQFRLSMTSGNAGVPYSIQSSVDLNDWTHEMTVIPLQFPFLVTNQTSVPSRFYRAVSQ